VLGLSIVSLSVIFLLDFGTVPTVWYILFFTLLGKRFKTLTFRLYDRSRDSSVIKSGGVKLVLWAQTSPLSEMTDAVMQVLSPYEQN
jgi:hypothetical protein